MLFLALSVHIANCWSGTTCYPCIICFTVGDCLLHWVSHSSCSALLDRSYHSCSPQEAELEHVPSLQIHHVHKQASNCTTPCCGFCIPFTTAIRICYHKDWRRLHSPMWCRIGVGAPHAAPWTFFSRSLHIYILLQHMKKHASKYFCSSRLFTILK